MDGWIEDEVGGRKIFILVFVWPFYLSPPLEFRALYLKSIPDHAPSVQR